MKKPKLISKEDADFAPLLVMCKGYIDFIDSDDYHEDNLYKQQIYEASMELFYGKDVWKYINSKIK